MARVMRPRNDKVLIRIETVEKVRGVAVPQSSQQGRRYIVTAIGNKVEDLSVGEEVLFIGVEGENWSRVPNEVDLLLISQANILMAYNNNGITTLGHQDDPEISDR